jgi:hypothetical protein
MTASSSLPARLVFLAALITLHLGGAALWLGLREGAISLWGFGLACLLQVPPALSLRARIQGGLGNTGLERELRTLRSSGFLLRLLALGMVMASVSALLGERVPQASSTTLGLAGLALGLLAPLWYAKHQMNGVHPTLELDAARIRTLLELAMLLLLGSLLGRAFPWADAVCGCAMALRLFFEGRTLSKATTLQVACGGCGSGCG